MVADGNEDMAIYCLCRRRKYKVSWIMFISLEVGQWEGKIGEFGFDVCFSVGNGPYALESDVPWVHSSSFFVQWSGVYTDSFPGGVTLAVRSWFARIWLPMCGSNDLLCCILDAPFVCKISWGWVEALKREWRGIICPSYSVVLRWRG